MAKFILKMAGILSIKEKLEEQAKVEYGLEIARLREEEERLRQMAIRKASYESRLKESLQDRLNVREIKGLENCVENIKYNMQLQRLAIKRQEAQVEKARQKLDEAMKERKTYEKLKEKAFEEYKLELAAQEQKEIDELVSFRYHSARESEVC